MRSVTPALVAWMLPLWLCSQAAAQTAQPEVIVSTRHNRCESMDVPDSPARAIRSAPNEISLVAAHYTNRRLRGPSFNDLRAACQIIGAGREQADPAAFDDRYWVQALYPGKAGHVIALGSHEYMGKRHPENCSAERTTSNTRCWYSSIVVAEGPIDALQLAPHRNRVVASSPHKYDPKLTVRTGFFTVSNIVRHDGFAYVFAYNELPEQRGNCLFRVPQNEPLGPWLAMKGGKFTQTFPSAYDDKSPVARNCDIVGGKVFRGPVRSVVWLSKAKKWMAVSMSTAKAGLDQADQSGVFYSLSDDLVNWSPRKRLFAGLQPWGQKACAEFYEYPSLIDHGSKSDIFDTVDSEEVYLYLTRFNFASCKKGLDRDLVRFRVKLPHS